MADENATFRHMLFWCPKTIVHAPSQACLGAIWLINETSDYN